MDKAKIFSLPLPRKPVELPEWDGTFYVRSLTAAEMDEFAAAMESDDRHGRAALAVRVLVDEQGERLFADEDVERLSTTQSFSTLQKIWEVAAPLNGLDAGKND